MIGTGYWGKNHLRCLHELQKDGFLDEIVLCDQDEVRAKAYSKSYDLPYVTDYRALAQDPTVDAVIVASPTNTHFKITKTLLEAGKDVLVEKPMTTRSADADGLIKSANEHDRILMVGHIFRHHPAVQELKRRIDRGEMGDVYYLFGRRLSYRPPRRDMGALFALGIHEVDLFCFLMGVDYPESISGSVGQFLQERYEEFGSITLEFARGTRGYAIESWLWPVGKKIRELVVVGSKQSARIDYFNTQGFELFDAAIVPETKGEDTIFQTLMEGMHVVRVPYREPLKAETLHFLECLETRQQPLSDMHAGKRAVVMIEKALDSASSGKAVYFG